jgi:hypothetical protein
MFFCTALLFSKTYQPVQFLDDIFNSFRVMSEVKFKVKNEQTAITPK